MLALPTARSVSVANKESSPFERCFAKIAKKATACNGGSGSLLSCPNDLKFLGK
ncbi:hypothetical protein X874_14370 [Mannheimia varigena USDA-ARS-USMARC-1312]|nr:hypothetical protein X874_14370 [Mannheimia varigena USDA-ARS-USMARC-1312]